MIFLEFSKVLFTLKLHIWEFLVLAVVDRVNVLLGLILGPLAVNEIQSLGLDLAVNESTSESSHDLLGLCMAVRGT